MTTTFLSNLLRGRLLASLVCIASVKGYVFYADLSPLGASKTAGSVAVFLHSTDGQVGYTGMVHDVEPSLTDALCSAPNGCGAHIHAGKSCESVATQLGHYYNNATIPTDPWMYERYYSDEAGHGLFGNVVNIGTSDVEGRAFIVHSANGTRVACGLLEKKTDNLFTAATKALGSAAAEAEISVYMPESRIVYLSGMAASLEPNLQGPPNGTDCTAPNGCGVHIHSGSSCFNVTTQGGHYYDNETLTVDPWAYVYYNLTDSDGQAHFAKTVDIGGITSIVGRPFILHSNNGSRVSCGILSPDSTDSQATSDAGGMQQGRATIRFPLSFIATLAVLWLG